MESRRHIESYTRNDNFPLALRHVPSQKNLALHSHDFFELVYVAGGKGVHFLGASRFLIGENNVFLIPPGVEHGYDSVESLELYNILFDRDRILSPPFDMERMPGYQVLFHIEPYLSGEYSDRRLLFVEKEVLSDLLAQLGAMLEGECEGWQFLSRILFERLLAAVFTGLLPVEEHTSLDRLSRIIPFIQGHLGEDLSLTRLCREAAMSRSALTRAFQSVYGVSPMVHVQEMRIDRAKMLLRDASLRIQEVGEVCGFSSSAYFSRVFRESTGRTPSGYRRGFVS